MGFDEYFDEAGLLTNGSNRDGGDSAQMMGLYRFGRYMQLRGNKGALQREQAKFAQELNMLTYEEWVLDKENHVQEKHSHPGVYVRHPKPCHEAWWANPRTFSRDQQRSLAMAMGALKQRKALWQIFWQHIKRIGWYQNDQEIDGKKKLADFAAPNILGEYTRAFYMAGIVPVAILWPVLLATDLSALVGLVINFAYTWKQFDSCDDDNDIMAHLQAKVALPTPISWLNRKLYKWFRPKCNAPGNGPISAFNRKHRSETGSPPFGELYTPILEREL